jgi:hypothetical protein
MQDRLDDAGSSPSWTRRIGDSQPVTSMRDCRVSDEATLAQCLRIMQSFVNIFSLDRDLVTAEQFSNPAMTGSDSSFVPGHYCCSVTGHDTAFSMVSLHHVAGFHFTYLASILANSSGPPTLSMTAASSDSFIILRIRFLASAIAMRRRKFSFFLTS